MNRYLSTILCICAAITLSQNVQAQAPTASFSMSNSSGCSPVVVNFTDNSTGSPTSWSWDLGNGVFSSAQNPSTTYFTAGTYTVILTATNANGSSKDTNYITVYPAPSISFIGDSLLSCPPKTVSFTNNTVIGGSSATYLWDFGDGDTSTSVSPTHIYTGTGNYNVTLVVSNNQGCTSTLTKSNYVKVDTIPSPNFTTANSSSCTLPFSVTFSNTSTGASSYYWDFGNGNTSTATNPSTTYTSAGSYNVKLVATNSSGCTDTIVKTAYINVGSLSAAFTKSTSSACLGQSVNFTNTTAPGPGLSIWHYGDGSIDTSTNATHSYSSTGTYTVKLIEVFSNCTDTATQTITVLQSPTAQFASSDTVGCGTNFSASFTNASVNANSYAWSFGDGNTSTATNPTNTYSALGVYNVKLIATSSNGCKDSITKSSFIKNIAPTGQVVSQAYYGCAPINIAFDVYVDSPLYANSYTWNYGDGTGTTSCSNCAATHHTFNSSGTYTITATYNTSASCADTVQTTITVGTVPTSGFTALPTTVCTSDTVNFTNSSSGADSYEWHFGDGTQSGSTNPAHLYNTPGVYTVSLVAMDHGCRDTFTRNNYITVSGPTASFSSAYTCSNRLSYTFTDQSSNGDVYLWEFGDGSTSSQVGNVSHTYASGGSYTVRLTVTDTTTGCSDAMTITLGVYDLNADFTADDTTVCANDVIKFTAASSVIISQYKWNFNDGNIKNRTGNKVQHAYANGGYHDVTLIVSDTAGCTDTLTKNNYIRAGGASVAFGGTPTSGCAPLNVAFTDSSSGNAGYTITRREWSYGDGSPIDTVAGTTTSHIYTQATGYHVKLTITDAGGCKSAVTKLGYINTTKPTASFSSIDTTVCIGDTVSFSNSSTYVSSSMTYVWDFGDGTTTTSDNPKHVYNASGSYTVRLITTSTLGGCKDTITRNSYITVEQPTAAFAMSDTVANCPPASINMTNSSSGASSYAWTFGNNTTSSLTNPTAIYTYPGTYQVKLIATSAAGCKDSISKNMVVYGPTGTFSYSAPIGCNPMTVNFSASSSNTTAYIWDMNNGYTQTTSGNTFSYTYTQGGYYIPKLILSDGASCLVPIVGSDTIKVDYIDGDFSYSSTPVCDSGSVQFTDTVLNTISTVDTRSWNFGDGGTSTAHNPSHTYTSSGTYTVTLIISNSTGCKDTIVKQVTIHTAPNISITPTTASICQGDTTGIQLTASGGASYTWANATTLSCSTCYDPVAKPTTTTSYVVTGTDTIGCSSKDTVSITVNPKPVISTSANTTICNGSSTVISASGANTYTWSPTTGLSCTTCNNPTASPSTTTTYTVIGSNAFGCKDTGDVTVNVVTKPVVSAGTNRSICNGDSVTLVATGASSYVWTPSTGLSCTGCDSTIASPTATTTYTVVGTAGNNCSDTATVMVTVNALPNVDAGNDKAICIGQSTTLQATGANTYVWSPATGLSCIPCSSPTANPTSTTTYMVTGIDGNGCKNTDTMQLTVHPLPTISAGNDVTICFNDSTQLQATGGTSYTWSPTNGLSCTSCSNPFAKPSATTTYTVTGTNSNGCSDTGTVTVTVNPLPTVNAGNNVSICAGSSTTLSASGATSYTWTPSTGLSCTGCSNPTANPTLTTTYTVTGTDANGCKNDDQVTVTVNPLPIVSAGNDVSICSGSNTTLSATGAVSYTWSPSTGLSCTSCASPTANPTTTTTYTVTGTDANGCVNTDQVTVTVNPLPNVSAGNDVSICNGSSTSLAASGAVNYTWSPSTGLSCTSCASPTANPTTTTTYTVTGTDVNGCKNDDQVTVTVNPLPNVSAGNDVSICNGSSTSLAASGAVSYTWSPSTGLSCTSCANPTANPTTTTTYTVTGTDANGCVNTDQVTVTVNPLPNVSAGNDVSICIGSSTSLAASGAVSYTWSPSTGLSCTSCANPTANPTVTTTYTVTGTDANGCVNTDQVVVTVNPLPNVSAGNNVTICNGSSTLLGATGASSYVWTPGTGLSCTNCPSPAASPTTTTTYTVTGTDANGCVNTDQVKVTVNPLPSVNAGNDVSICIGDSTQLQAIGAANYTWTPSTGLSCTTCASPTANPTTTTAYIVTGTGSNSCSDTDTVVVTVNPLPVINVAGNMSICKGDTTQLQATGANTYTWTPNSGLSCSGCANPLAYPNDTTTYIITGTDTNGCKNTIQETIIVKPVPIVAASNNQVLCVGDSTQLQANGATNYSWTPATGLSCTNCAQPYAKPVNPTTYIVTGSTNGCSDTASVTINVLQHPVVTGGPNIDICVGNSDTLKPTGGVSYTWTPSSGLSCTGCKNPITSTTTTTTYIVTGIDANGCKDTGKVLVTVHNPPSINAGDDKTVCDGQSTQLIATGAQTYTWSPASTLSCTNCADPIAKPSINTTYMVIGTDQWGCSDSDKINIELLYKDTFTVSLGDTICEGESAQLSATGGDQYIWLPAEYLDNNTSSSPTASPLFTTNYQVVIKQKNCFTDTANVLVKVNTKPIIDLGADRNISGSESVMLDVTNFDHVQYEWTPAIDLSCTDCGKVTANPTLTRTYKVRVTNTAGCVSEDEVTIHVTCGGDQLFLANTFTPNGDGLNDRFYPQGRGVSSVKMMRIYNRWGEVVFERQDIPLNDPTYGWDGTYNNLPLKPDVFIYVISATCDTGEPIQIKGDISIVR